MTTAARQNDFEARLQAVTAELIQLECELALRNRRRDELLALRARIETERACARGERVLSLDEVRSKLRNISRQGFEKLRKNTAKGFPKAVYVDSDPGYVEHDVDEWIRKQVLKLG